MEVVDERHLNTFEQIININTRSLPGHHLNAFLAYIVHRLQSNITIPRSLSYTTTLPTPTKTRHVITTINRPHIILYKPFTQPIHPSIMTSQMTLWHSYERKSSWCRTFLLFGQQQQQQYVSINESIRRDLQAECSWESSTWTLFTFLHCRTRFETRALPLLKEPSRASPTVRYLPLTKTEPNNNWINHQREGVSGHGIVP